MCSKLIFEYGVDDYRFQPGKSHALLEAPHGFVRLNTSTRL
jgi:hypothetical protein